MQETSPKTTAPTPARPTLTASGYYDFLTSIFPRASTNGKIAYVLRAFLLVTPEPFTAQSVVDCLKIHGSDIEADQDGVTLKRLTASRTPTTDVTHVPEVMYWTTRLTREEIQAAMNEAESMDHLLKTDMSLVPRAMFREVIGSTLKVDVKNAKPTPEPAKKDLNKITVVPVTPGLAGTTIAFDDAGKPSIKVNAPTKDEPKVHEYSEASVKQEAERVNCGTAIRNMLLMQEGRTRLGLSAVHDAMRALGYDKATILEAIDAATRTGELFMEGNALIPSTMLPSTLAGWGPTIIDLNREKGWYDEEQLSEKAARALAKLSADEQAELLKHMPLIPHREPKGRIDVATFCTNLTGEISELWEAYRKGELDKPCDKAAKMKSLGLPGLTCAEEEIADILIRTLDTAEFWGLDISRAMKAKHLYNASRSFRHGNKRA